MVFSCSLPENTKSRRPGNSNRNSNCTSPLIHCIAHMFGFDTFPRKTGMPCLEEIPKVVENMTAEDITTPPPEHFDGDFEGLSREIPENDIPIVREITQTDRLNSRLLKSLLNRMNTGEVIQLLSNDNVTEEQSSDEFEK